MRFAEYGTCILALLQEDGMGRPALEASVCHLVLCAVVCCHNGPSQTATQTVFFNGDND